MKGEMKVIGFEKSQQSEYSCSIFLRLPGLGCVVAGVTEEQKTVLLRLLVLVTG